jgi:hypothetical protein
MQNLLYVYIIVWSVAEFFGGGGQNLLNFRQSFKISDDPPICTLLDQNFAPIPRPTEISATECDADEFILLLGKSKCMSKTGDCIVKHPNSHAVGMGMVVS